MTDGIVIPPGELTRFRHYVYLAGPYTHPNHWVREERYNALTRAAALIMRSRLSVYSPVTQGHIASERVDLPDSFEFWKRLNLPLLLHAYTVYVLTLDGWQESHGVDFEIRVALQRGIPVTMIELGLRNIVHKGFIDQWPL